MKAKGEHRRGARGATPPPAPQRKPIRGKKDKKEKNREKLKKRQINKENIMTFFFFSNYMIFMLKNFLKYSKS